MGKTFFKRSRTRRSLRAISILIISIGSLLFLAGAALSFVAQKKAKTEFQKINGAFSSLRINLFARSVTVKNITWESPVDSFPHKIKIGRVQLSGISLFKLLVHKQLYAQELLIDSGGVQFNQSQKRDSIQAKDKKTFAFEIENIIIRNIFAEAKRDTVTEMEGLLNLRYGALKFDSPDSILTSCKSAFQYFEGDISSVKLTKRGGFYTSRVDNIQFNSLNRSVMLDSVKLIPNYSKYDFGKTFGRQVTRLKLNIKRVDVTGLNYQNLFDSLISISKISIHNTDLYTFRDKRIPFLNTKIIPMPMTSLGAMAFGLEIDSIAIDDAVITIEEFAPTAVRPGYVNFKELRALMVGLSNRYYVNKPRYAQLDASAKIMGNGLINASFRFPLDGSSLYSAKGKVEKLSLPELNPMLENSAQVRIESGNLNELFFNFNYTDFKSDGTVEINYEDLKLTKLNPDKEKSVDHFKTVLINAFLKKTKDETTEQRKRIGTIDAERDRRRFIFNLWWKSLQSGLKSSVLGNEKVGEKAGEKK
jgi:hypothetical protein